MCVECVAIKIQNTNGSVVDHLSVTQYPIQVPPVWLVVFLTVPTPITKGFLMITEA